MNPGESRARRRWFRVRVGLQLAVPLILAAATIYSTFTKIAAESQTAEAVRVANDRQSQLNQQQQEFGREQRDLEKRITFLELELALSRKTAAMVLPESPAGMASPTQPVDTVSNPATTGAPNVECHRRFESHLEPRSIAAQLVYDVRRKQWRKQLLLLNGAAGSLATQEMEDFARGMTVPMAPPQDVEPDDFVVVGFTLLAANGEAFPEVRGSGRLSAACDGKGPRE